MAEMETQNIEGVIQMKDFLSIAKANLVYANEALADAVNVAEKDPDVAVILKLFLKQRELYEEMDEVRKLIFNQLEYLSRTAIPERFSESGVTSMTIDGVRYTLGSRTSTTMTDKSAGFDWLKEHGHGDIIQPTVNAQTLSAFARRYLEDTGSDLPGNLFKTTMMKYTSATKV
jgi:hypothetical protein